MGIAEINLDISGHGETFAPSHFRWPIPCQRLIELLLQLAGIPDDRLAILAGDLNQHDLACLAFDKYRNLAAAATAQQIAFPVSRYRAAFNCRGAFADRYGVANPAVIIRLLRVMARTLDSPNTPQVLQQFLRQSTTGQHGECDRWSRRTRASPRCPGTRARAIRQSAAATTGAGVCLPRCAQASGAESGHLCEFVRKTTQFSVKVRKTRMNSHFAVKRIPRGQR
jgi:hypothetical protein